MDLDQRLALANTFLSDIISKGGGSGNQGKQMLAKGERVKEYLLIYDLGYIEKLRPGVVIPHSDNRDGQGLDPVDVHALLERILAQGFVKRKTQEACCIEIGPSNRDQQIAFNKKLVIESDGLLPDFCDHDVRALSISSSHTNAGFRCAEAGGDTFLEEEFCTDGKLNKEKVKAMDPAYAAACEDGVEWFIIRWQVEQMIPNIASFLQEAFNSGHGTERLQTSTQCLMQIHAHGLRNKRSHGDYQWGNVVKSMEASKHHLKNKVWDLVGFVQKWSGGPTACFLKDIDVWTKTLKNRREVSHVTFRAIGSLDFVGGPEFAIAMLKACLIAPDQHCKQGVSQLLTSTDIGSILTKNKADAMKLVGIVRAAKSFCKDVMNSEVKGSLTDLATTKLIGDLEVRLVMVIFKKKCKQRVNYDTMDEVSAAFLQDLYKVCPDCQAMPAPFAAADKSDTPSPKSQPTEDGLFSFVEGGGIDLAHLANHHFKLGSIVQKKKLPEGEEAVRYAIVEIDQFKAVLRELYDDEKDREDGIPNQNTDDDEDDVEVEKVQSLTIATGALMDEWKATVSPHILPRPSP